MTKRSNQGPQYNINISNGLTHPGSGYNYTICDICGKKFRAKDTILVKEKYNQLNGLVVCKADYDPIDPQLLPIKIRKEKQLSNPKLIRTEGSEDYAVITSISEIENGNQGSDSGNAPSVPRNLKTTIVTSSAITLEWDFPLVVGGASITGWKIERESPTGNGFSTLVTNTELYETSYTDLTVSASTQYNYRVSAINRFGTSSTSNEAAATTGA